MHDAIYFPLLLGSFSEVPVFAPTLYPSIAAFFPPPSDTTVSSTFFITSDVSFDMTFFFEVYLIFIFF